MLRLQVPGSVDLVSKHVAIRDGSFYIVFRGDVKSLKLKDVALIQDKQHWEVEVEERTKEASLLLKCKLSNDAQVRLGSAKLAVGDKIFSLEVVAL